MRKVLLGAVAVLLAGLAVSEARAAGIQFGAPGAVKGRLGDLDKEARAKKPKAPPPNVLDNAVFYAGSTEKPTIISYTNSTGTTVAMEAYPGEVMLIFSSATAVSDAKALVEQNGGSVVEQIPKLGFYLATVSVGQEAAFISAVQTDSRVKHVSPNPSLPLQTVDLSRTGKNDPRDLVVALLSSPDPNSRIILAQLDDFLNDPHGNDVEAVRKNITGNVEGLRIHVGGLECRLPAALCASGNQAARGLAAVIAGAEINGQKVAVNMSWGVNPRTTDAGIFDTTNGTGANAWAVPAWEAVTRSYLDVLANSEWVKKGNVTLSKSADNGSLLVNGNGDILNRVGIDVTDALARFNADPRYAEIMNYVTFLGALNADGTLASYSNSGPGVVFGVPPGAPGTSFVAPQGQGASYNAWINNPNASGDLVQLALALSATENANGFLVINTGQVGTALANIISVKDQIVNQTGLSEDQAILAILGAVDANANGELVAAEALARANAIKSALEDDNPEAVNVTGISFTSVGSVTAAVITPAISGVSVQYSVSGTDGYYANGTQQTNSAGQVSFGIPPGANGVVDTISVTAVISGVQRVTTHTW